MMLDVVVVGGGPAGLSAAIESARRGLSVTVLERRRAPLDKACGEGIMPSGVASLERLGVRSLLACDELAPFERIAWRDDRGRSVEAALPSPGGLGVRRVELVRAMREAARNLGVTLVDECACREHRVDRDAVTLRTDACELRARLLVAADGLHSPLRKSSGLEGESSAPRRFGLRRHASVAPWSRAVEVHFADGVEAYVTPSGAHRVGVAFLWEHERVGRPSFEGLLARFPALSARLSGVSWETPPRGAGPLHQPVRARVSDRLVLVGDAAGYVDAITGEGLSLAFESAETLGTILPEALSRGASAASLAPYERATASAFRRYAALASLLVATTRHPPLRRALLAGLVAFPSVFACALRLSTRAHTR